MENRLICCDAIKWLSSPRWAKCHMIFADPPDSIGLKYKGYKDKTSEDDYHTLLYSILTMGSQKADVMWLSINPIHTALIGRLTYDFLADKPDWQFKPCVQTFTFGQNNSRDLGIGHRLLYRYMRKDTKLYPERILVPSWRQLNGDKRANPAGRVPLDVFDFPRVTGNSKQRRNFSPTQLHEGLYERCIRLCCKPGSEVCDLFAGSGTLGRVGERCEVNTTMLEISRETCDNILADQPTCKELK